MSTTPVTVYVNGKLITSDPDQPTAEAIAVADGHLLAVGSEREARAAARPPGSSTSAAGA